MIAELGQFSLALALAMAMVQGIVPLLGFALSRGGWSVIAAPAARGQCAFLLLAFVCLTHGFLTSDFSVAYVAAHSNSLLPANYRIAAVWGGHEGSLLLWALILSAWAVAVSACSRSLPAAFAGRTLAVMGLISCGILAFLIFTSNPFTRLLPAPMDGNDLNPLLQDPGLVMHPPLLYMGYVGFTVPFALAIAALLEGRFDANWARWSRPWTVAAWSFLTVGIALGSFWAYYELGWGGWWFWDPVENASFMPWLTGTALMHSLIVADRRGGFKGWTILLAIITFSLSLLGTFLVRSGVLTSVHAFATDPGRGIFVLAFLALVAGASLALYAWRAPRIREGMPFAALSRETLLLSNNVLLAVAAATVLLGTLYPLLLDALDLGKISVGPPYFETVLLPVFALLAFLLAIGPVAQWQRARLPDLATRLRWALGVSATTGILTPLLMGRWSAWVALGMLLAAWITAATLFSAAARLRPSGTPGSWKSRLAALPPGYGGMMLAHLGVAVFIAGVTLSRGYSSETVTRLAPGETTSLGDHVFRLEGSKAATQDNYFAQQARISVSRHGRPEAILLPEKRFYPVQNKTLSEAAIDRGITRDLYVTLGDALPGNAWVVHLHHKPCVNWIWIGCLLMACGGLLTLTDRRYRLRRREKTQVMAPAALQPATQS